MPKRNTDTDDDMQVDPTEEEVQETTAHDANDTAPSTEEDHTDVISPPGVKTRAVRSGMKRRKSEIQAAAANQTAAAGDTTTTNTNNEEEEEEDRPAAKKRAKTDTEPPSTLTATKSTSTAASSKNNDNAIPHMEKLRVPSQQTPAKQKKPQQQQQPNADAQRNGNQIPQPSMALILDQEREDQRRVEAANNTEANNYTAASMQQIDSPAANSTGIQASNTDNAEINRSPVALQPPSQQDPQQEQQNPMEPTTALQQVENWCHQQLYRTRGWFLLIFLLQLLCTGIVINPLLTVTVGSSKVALSVYKTLLGAQPPLPTSSPSPLQPQRSPEEMRKEQAATEHSAQRIQYLQDLTGRLTKARDQITQDAEELGEVGMSFRETSRRQAEARAANQQNLSAAFQQKLDLVQGMLDKEERWTAQDWNVLRETVGEPDSDFLLDLTSLTFWEINDNDEDSCSEAATVTAPPGLLHKDELQKAVDMLRHEIQHATTTMKQTPEIENKVRHWVQEAVDSQPIELNVGQVEDSKPARTVKRGSTLTAIRRVLQARLEQEHADRTGKVDYAALRNGAAIIKTGKFATSPSLVDMLPYVNRLAASLSLRFYGHGPEVAIMPTYPTDALGQCWAFQLDKDSSMGRYATLSIQLARPLQVDTVSIEHPPREMNDKSKAAIRSFRVIGFESPNATGKQWNLGAFEFSLTGDIIQEFDVLTEDEDGDDIPPLQSLAVAIDSNWGLQYSCLYRFRVHGEELASSG